MLLERDSAPALVSAVAAEVLAHRKELAVENGAVDATFRLVLIYPWHLSEIGSYSRINR